MAMLHEREHMLEVLLMTLSAPPALTLPLAWIQLTPNPKTETCNLHKLPLHPTKDMICHICQMWQGKGLIIKICLFIFQGSQIPSDTWEVMVGYTAVANTPIMHLTMDAQQA